MQVTQVIVLNREIAKVARWIPSSSPEKVFTEGIFPAITIKTLEAADLA